MAKIVALQNTHTPPNGPPYGYAVVAQLDDKSLKTGFWEYMEAENLARDLRVGLVKNLLNWPCEVDGDKIRPLPLASTTNPRQPVTART